MTNIGAAARELRELKGWTQRRTAAALDITAVHLCNIEAGRNQPSPELLERYRAVFGIDLYVYAWCQCEETESLPESIRESACKLTAEWRRQITEQSRDKAEDQMEVSHTQCSISAK